MGVNVSGAGCDQVGVGCQCSGAGCDQVGVGVNAQVLGVIR